MTIYGSFAQISCHKCQKVFEQRVPGPGWVISTCPHCGVQGAAVAEPVNIIQREVGTKQARKPRRRMANQG